jgi:DNA-binding NarL/FixJ family response regulator
MNGCIRIAVVDRHPLFREGVAQIIAQRGLAVVAEGETAADACRIAENTPLDVMLVDINIPGDGLDAAGKILRRSSGVKVAILTAFDDDEHVCEALRAGVQGYVLKGVSCAELIRAIETIHRGEPYITPALASRILVQRRETYLAQDRAPSDNRGLTPREMQALRCLAKGLTNSEIAVELGVTVRYTKYLLTTTYRKMRVRNRVAAILEMQKMGLSGDSGLST